MFTSVLRTPDSVTGATETSVYRFEERPNVCDVKYEYNVGKNSAKVIVYPSGAPVQYLKFRFRGDFSLMDKVYGDDWGRTAYMHPLTWTSLLPERCLPWFCYCVMEGKTHCYGVKTGPNCFASWYVDSKGITLFLDLSNGKGGTRLKAPLLACEVVELEGEKGEDTFAVAKKFAGVMCDNPVLPKEPIFGVNNWYWAYGNISRESVLEETDYLMKMTQGTKHRPYMIIDDGWQKHRKVNTGEAEYKGGEWLPNEKFGDMKTVCDEIHQKGAKAGLWFRPLLARGDFSEEQVLTEGFSGRILDPSHPEVLRMLEEDTRRIRSWGFDLIKHDFTQIDMFGTFGDGCEISDDKNLYSRKRSFFDKTITNAMIAKNLYKAIARGAGDAEVIACNAFGHLAAGIHSIYRVGMDTSGKVFEITRSDGVNSMMRLPLNNEFFVVDPDCAAITDLVDKDLNLDFLEMCAITGVTTLASVVPNILTDEEMKRINKIFKTADSATTEYGIKNFDKTCCPDVFVDKDGTEKAFDWYRKHDGVRVRFAWDED